MEEQARIIEGQSGVRCEHCRRLVQQVLAVGSSRVCPDCVTGIAHNLHTKHTNPLRIADYVSQLSQELYDLATDVYMIIDADTVPDATGSAESSAVDGKLLGAYQSLQAAAKNAQEARAHLLRYHRGKTRSSDRV